LIIVPVEDTELYLTFLVRADNFILGDRLARLALNNNNGILFQVMSPLFQYRKGSTWTGGKCDSATGSEVCQFVYGYMIVSWYPMVLGGAVGGAREILANVVGKRGQPGSCALEALPNVQEGHVGTGWDRFLSVWLLCGPWWPLSLWRNKCECLDDQFVIVRERRGRFG
jgi:hypothetical protein